MGGHVDHVHLLIGLSRTISIAKLVERIKTETSRWAKSANGGSPLFAWQAGYGVFSVSHSSRGEVDSYIRAQAKHHKEWSFQEEFRAFCQRHEIEIDERYVWDWTGCTIVFPRTARSLVFGVDTIEQTTNGQAVGLRDIWLDLFPSPIGLG